MSLRVDSANPLLALRSLRIGRGSWGGGGLFIPSAGFLHPLIFPLFLELLGLSVGHIAELLHPSGKDSDVKTRLFLSVAIPTNP